MSKYKTNTREKQANSYFPTAHSVLMCQYNVKFSFYTLAEFIRDAYVIDMHELCYNMLFLGMYMK